MDPQIAPLTWLTIRGTSDGFLFCDLSQDSDGFSKLNPSKPLISARFTTTMRKRLLSIEIGPGDVLMYSGHSIKRGSVQLLRTLGLRDEYVMQKVQMVGARSYANYCEAYNDCKPDDLPRFSSVEQCLQHAAYIRQQKEILLDETAFSNFLAQMSMKQSDE